MTTEETPRGEELDKLTANLEKIEELSKRLSAAMAHKQMIRPSLQGPGQEFYLKAAAAYLAEMMSDPGRIIEQQVGYWGKTLKHAVEAQHALAKGDKPVPPDATGPDPRFANPMWDNHPYFNFLKQQYMISSGAMSEAISGLAGLDERDRRKMDYFSRQMVDLMSPANYFATNPDALERAVETEGQSIIDGLENMIRDLEANDGELMVTLADPTAFTVGENLATTEGSVVFRNRMFELIQYAPATESVYATPLLIFPPWINKYYILDLKPQNSMIKWLTEQGFTVFVVSWVNPDPSYAEVGMETYIEEGYLTAMDQVKAITGKRKLNVVGYCIAGTALSLTLALLKSRGDKTVNSATFFTTLTDFSDQGEFSVFLDDDFVDGIEAEVAEKGILPWLYMSRTFSYLRSNDLIYKPAINSYMLGQKPPAFDLLYWNSDSTNMAGKMTVQYLRELCQKNAFAGEGKGFRLLDVDLRVEDVEVPLFAVACETDHIAAWKSSYRGISKMGSKDKTFIMSESGHIAGIINPPSKKKYGHYTNTDWPGSPDDWREGAERHDGTWWGRWSEWLAGRSGKKIPARIVGDSGQDVLGPAPGTYVTAQPRD